jgi:hypothetical protein
MEKLNFSTTINAPKEKVWKSLWEDANYREWTSVFHEGSYAKTDNWKEGSKVLFLGPGESGKESGMVSRVAANRENEFMSFEHLGEIKDGVEDTTSEKVKIWAGAHENYRLKENNGTTELSVELDIDQAGGFADYFKNTFPLALDKVKKIAEN